MFAEYATPRPGRDHNRCSQGAEIQTERGAKGLYKINDSNPLNNHFSYLTVSEVTVRLTTVTVFQ